MTLEQLKAELERKEIQLKDILEITQAININSSEESLYTIYRWILQGSLHVGKLALYVYENNWRCKVHFGTHQIPVALDVASIAHLREPCLLKDLPAIHNFFQDFDWVMPILYKDETLAYIFVEKYEAKDDTAPRTVNLNFLQTLTNIIIVAIENKKLVRNKLKQELHNQELEIAKRVQSMLIPRKLPATESLTIRSTYLPHDLIGGDYYDYIPLAEGKFLVCIADVSGKGVPAALLMSNFQATLRMLVRHTYKLKNIIDELNLLIFQNAQGEHFITFFLAIYDTRKKILRYINAGHNPPYLLNKTTGKLQALETGTTVLGFLHNLPFINEEVIRDIDNFLLFCFTDGVPETINPQDEQFGAERIGNILQKYNYTSLIDLHAHILDRLYRFKQDLGFTDDITILSCRVKNNLPAPEEENPVN
jgi:sigma-B regulation protein RsbU (phosphoserine phosphatase)